MSAKMMGLCWDLNLPANKLLVLLALTDHADHQGNNIFPSIALVAWKIGYSVSQTRRIMRKLETDGILSVEKRKGQTNIYHVDLSKGKPKPPFSEKSDPLQNDTPSITMQGGGLHPDDTPTPVIHMTPEPSIETSNNHHISAGAETKPEESEKPRRKRTWRDDYFDVLTEHAQIGVDQGMTVPGKAQTGKVITQLRDEGLEWNQVEGLYRHVAWMAKMNHWKTWTLGALPKYAADYLATLKARQERVKRIESNKSELPAWARGTFAGKAKDEDTGGV